MPATALADKKIRTAMFSRRLPLHEEGGMKMQRRSKLSHSDTIACAVAAEDDAGGRAGTLDRGGCARFRHPRSFVRGRPPVRERLLTYSCVKQSTIKAHTSACALSSSNGLRRARVWYLAWISVCRLCANYAFWLISSHLPLPKRESHSSFYSSSYRCRIGHGGWPHRVAGKPSR